MGTVIDEQVALAEGPQYAGQSILNFAPFAEYTGKSATQRALDSV